MEYLGEVEAKTLLAEEGLTINPTFQVDTLDEALERARFLGYPVVLKVSSNKIVHKSDVGGVVLDISNPRELKEAFISMEEKMKAIDPQASFSLQPHIKGGVELAVGTSTDPSFGKVIMFSLGGIWIEALGDAAFRLVPIEERDALEMIEEIRGKRMLEGIRGYPAVDRGALARFLLDVSAVAHRKGITEMDLNPVFACGERLLVADARLVMGG